jgi:uncharacterized protein with PIN domain
VNLERYRCPKCNTYVLAHEVDEVVEVWPPDVEPNSSEHGLVKVVVRPGPLFCHSEHHPHPVGMKRESFEFDQSSMAGRGLLRKIVRRGSDG